MNPSSYAMQLEALHQAIVHRRAEPMLSLIKASPTYLVDNATRLAVYADGYEMRLIDAVLADYPALAHYLGDKECREYVTCFVTSTPSRFWDLNLYPIAFANYLKNNLSDLHAHALADLESTIVTVFWEKETKPLVPEQLMTISEEALGDYPLKLRQAARLLELDSVAHAYVTAFRAGLIPVTVSAQKEYLLIIRLDNEVQRVVLEPMEYQLLHAIHHKGSLNRAFVDITDQGALAGMLPIYMSRWFSLGVFSEN